jgi:hypothetical protein
MSTNRPLSLHVIRVVALVVDLQVLLDPELFVAQLALEVKIVGVNCLLG